MEELLKNADEFLESGDDNIKKRRYNASVSDYFKAIVILCDYLIYKETKSLPKNHNERFYMLNKYFKNIHDEVSKLFEIYTKSYSLRMTEEEAEVLKNYSHGLKNFIINKK